MEQKPFLEVKDLSVVYTSEGKVIHAVNDISFSLERGKTLALIGETGAGKTTVARSILRILPDRAAKITSGSVCFDGQELLSLSEREMGKIRGNRISMVFQDPMTALNPIMKVGRQIAEAVMEHSRVSKAAARRQAEDMLELVGIPRTRYDNYPHEFSGGMKQRVVIAMALACSPELLLADEPTTALDVTIQAQILKLMNDLKREHGTSILFITHDLGVIAQMADDVAVMYCGQVVEMAPAKTLFTDCEFSHPYTEGLMVSIPRLDTPAGVRLESIPGSVPHPLNLPKGCKFAPRCKYCQQRCLEEEPELVNVTEEQQVRCFYPRKEERRANLK